MQYKLILFMALALCTTGLSAQTTIRKHRESTGAKPSDEQLQIKRTRQAEVPPAENPFGLPLEDFKSMPAARLRVAPAGVTVTRDADGTPIFWEGIAVAERENNAAPAVRAQRYATSINPEGLTDAGAELLAGRTATDDQGEYHVRLQQYYKGIPVYGGELVAHTRNGVFDRMGGRYHPTPKLADVTPTLDANAAIEKVKAQLRSELKAEWTDAERQLVGGQPFEAALVVYHVGNDAHLTWHIEAHPNLLRRYVYFIDAQTGAVLNHYDHTCRIDGGRHAHGESNYFGKNISAPEMPNTATVVNGPVVANGTDLLGANRSFGAWQIGSTNYLIDGSRPMYNVRSRMPADPVGAIVTLDAFNTSPENSRRFNYANVTSVNLTFNSAAGVSAHYNAIASYEYFRTKFNRNSIDGIGGNVISFFNVAESDGTSMENAFWNGEAIWYGNGGRAFSPLARSLDVAGHEMSHGVIEKTANLEYQNESGAMNESFADIFGAMIDRDDWKIGEDVMRPGVHSTNALRDMANPNNGDSRLGPWWQPRNMSERYIGTEDNGGVHINSGIPNYAYYLFATNNAVGKDRAEQVFYKALRDYLVRSSSFADLRVAVLQAANDLYGNTVATAAGAAFDQVGIVGNSNPPNNNALSTLAVNPGTDLVLVVSNDKTTLKLATGTGQILGNLYTQGVKSRPSVTDDGTEVVFVNNRNQLIDIVLTYSQTGITPRVDIINEESIWSNVSISKDGRYIAAVLTEPEPFVYIYDFGVNPVRLQKYELFNPTYSRDPRRTNEVKYADILEFDYSGRYLMYDAFNEFKNTAGQTISYWDIGFLEFWKNGAFVNPANVFISKLFNGLPEDVGVGNPTFSKNSPFIIAFDYIDEGNNRVDIYGANVQTGATGVLAQNIGDIGVPNFNRLDNSIIYQRAALFGGLNIVRQGIDNTKIRTSGSVANFVNSHEWGVWFSNGRRSLTTSTTTVAQGETGITLSPNPATDVVRLVFEAEKASNAQLRVLDMAGRVVLEQNATISEGDNQLNFNTAHLPSGTYFVVIKGAQVFATVRMIRQ
jgi:bacillolysin